MFLQEVGDVRGLSLGCHREDFAVIAGKEFVAYIANPEKSHRCSALLVACALEFKLHEVQVHEVGVSVRGKMLEREFYMATMHFPHAHRPDAVEVWRANTVSLQETLDRCPADATVLIGQDLNQNLHAEVDDFEGMMHMRQFLARTGLEVSPDQGVTWVARGSESAIDFFLFRAPCTEVSFWKREDFRLALPSDHNAVGMSIRLATGRTPLRRRPRQTRCGKWVVRDDALWEHMQAVSEWDQETVATACMQPGVCSRPPSLRYNDPPEVKDLIERRKKLRDPDARAALMQEIHFSRKESKQQHKEDLLRRAKAGDRRAIAHMRSSAAAGGLTTAVKDLHAFYTAKYDSDEPPIGDAHWEKAIDRHAGAHTAPVTREELQKALAKCNPGVSAGLDGVTFEGLKVLLRRDTRDRLPMYFTRLLRGELPVPEGWRQGKIVLLPKVPRPSCPKDLRPVCLVPSLSRLYAKVLDGIVAAQSTMSLVKRMTGRTAKVAKLDIKAAFDSVSHQAVFQWLMACEPCAEALSIMRLCFGTEVRVGLGGMDKTLSMKRGIMQGSAFSADVFSRVMDWYLAPLVPLFHGLFPEWESQIQGIPHFLIYADDLIIFADTERVLNDISGSTPGLGYAECGHTMDTSLDAKCLRASWVSDLAIRKMQKTYVQIEVYAQDRKKWGELLPCWIEHWLPAHREPQSTAAYLFDRQLVLLRGARGVEQMYLRPAKDILDEPYECSLLQIREAKHVGAPLVWLLPDPVTFTCQAVLFLGGRDAGKQVVVQVRPVGEDTMASAISLLTLGCKLVLLLTHLGRPGARLVAPLQVLRREFFQEAVPMPLLADLPHLLSAFSKAAPSICLPPKPVPDDVKTKLGQFKAVTMPTKYLVRAQDFF
ncbi:unnamed protein product [Symbiodinium sp. CCMP2592]|nr:unnamed protein product [Symbiodinium sp. CCMP2592]